MAESLQERMERLRWTERSLVEHLKIKSRQTFRRAIKGGETKKQMAIRTQVEEFFDKQEARVHTSSNVSPIAQPLGPARHLSIPIYGDIPAGPLTFTEARHPEMIDIIGFDPKQHFALRVHGGSMEPDYKDGDIVILRRIENVAMPPKEDGPTHIELFSRYVGKTCAMLIDETETTLKRLEIERTGSKPGEFMMILRPLNPNHPTRVIGPKNSFRIQGEVVKLMRDI